MSKPVVRSAAFKAVAVAGLTLPEVEATTDWSGAPVLRLRGCFMAGLASHPTAEPDSLVVRCALDDRERLIEDAADTYYVTDFYHPYPVVLARLSQLTPDALRDLLSVSWRMTLDKSPRRRSRTP
ncbi:MAG: MmcQ/YjbR family DNA-binding protein [Vicinamibacterales bacterium]